MYIAERFIFAQAPPSDASADPGLQSTASKGNRPHTYTRTRQEQHHKRPQE